MTDHHGTRSKASATACGCDEMAMTMTRRGMMGLTASLFSAATLPSWAMAAGSSAPRLLVVVLRGGLDGLSTVVPHGDPNYAPLRGDLALPGASTIPLDSFFGLNPAMPNFGHWFSRGTAAVVHASCVPLQNRSHFDCQDNLESGLGGIASNPTGWLNRLLTALPSTDPVRRAGAIEIGDAPLILRGPAPVLGWSPTWFSDTEAITTSNILANYDALDRGLYKTLKLGLAADALADRAGNGGTENLSSLRRGFIGAARLMRAQGGPHIAVLNVGGFDTHADQGVLSGFLYDVLSELDTALGDFRAEAGTMWSNTVVVCATEFGRTAARNGSLGTDHGVGTVALMAGGAVNGKRIFGDWPGLRAADLLDGSDLRPTTDIRRVFKGILRAHLDVPRTLLDNTIFPGSGSLVPMVDLIKPAGAAEPRLLGPRATDAPLRGTSPLAEYRRRYAS